MCRLEIFGENCFSRHADYAADEMRRGLYLREYTALTALLGAGAREGSEG